MDSGRVEEFGSEESPDLTLGELARIAVARPSAADAVRVEGDLYVDAAAADPLAAASLLDRGGFDHVLTMNGSERNGLAFYDLFLDRRDWPALIRRGHDNARAALQDLSRAPGAPRRSPKR
jgi:hypothetical protein